MVYKKYIKRDGKIYGPYKYHSRKINGKVITEYRGKAVKKKKINTLFLIIGFILVFSLIFVLNDNFDFVNGIKITKSTFNNIITPITKSLTGFVISENKTISEEQIILGQPVKWKKYFLINSTNNSIKLPEEAEKIKVKKINSENKFSQIIENLRITGNVIQQDNEITINEIGQYQVEYETPAPYAIEEELEKGKRVKIIGPETIHYENVLAFTDLDEGLDIRDKSKIRIYWIEDDSYVSIQSIDDTNANGIYDYIEWIVPQLSSQTYEIIIEITKAEHLDSNRNFISDIYEEVKELDDIWSETILAEDYVRVTFEQELDSSRDITVYPRIVSGNPRVEVYEVDGTEIIAEFTNIISNEYNKVFLTNLQGTQDVFDLRVLDGSIEIDYIVDPTEIKWADSHLTGTVSTSANALGATSGSWTTDTGNTDWDSRFSIENPSAGITGTQTIRVLTRKDASAGGTPTLDVYVYENGVLVQQIVTTFSVTSTTGENVTGTFDASAITNRDDVEIRVAAFGDGGGPNGRTAQIDSIMWDVNLIQDNPPQWFDNSTNSTLAGEPVEHKVRWTDNDLSGYIFEFDNGNGTFFNDSFVIMTGTNNWSNVTKVVNSTQGSTIRWRVYANDSADQWNVTDIFQYTITVDNPPTWSNPSENDSTPNPGQTVRHNVYWQDDIGLSYATLEVNSSGVNCDQTENVSSISLSLANEWANLSWTIPNACEGKTIGWRQYANDSLNQWNSSMPLQTYTVKNINPIASFGTNPADANESNSQSITFELKCSDNLGVDELQLWGNWTGIWHANQTNSSPVNNTYWNINVDGIPDGKGHVWAVWCNDSVGNENMTGTNRTFTVDSIGPTINTEGANETNISQNEWFCLNITAIDATSDVSIVYARVWNTTNWYNVSMTNTLKSCGGGGSIYSADIQGTAQGIWNYSKVYANDTLNNWDSYDFSDLTINVTAPADNNYPQFSGFAEDPLNDSAYSFEQSYQFNSTITYTNGTIFLDFNGTNYSASNDTVTNFYVDIASLAAGNYNYYWWGYGNGTQNHYNSSDTRVYVVQKATPVLTKSLNGTDGDLSITYPQEVNASASTTAGTVNIYRNSTDVTSKNNIYISLSAGYYEYEFNVTGNTNYTDLSSVFLYATISKAIGEIATYIDNQPDNVSALLNTEKWLNATLITGVGNITLWYNNTLIENGTSPLSNLTNFTSEGEFNVSGIYSGNENYTSHIETWWVTVSSDNAPDVTLNFPTPDYNSNSTNIQFNCTADDDINLVNVSLYGNWSGWHLNQTNDTGINNANYIFSKTISDGIYVWNCKACDSISQCSFDSANYTFSVDTVYPLIEFVFPTTDEGNYSQNYITANVTASDLNLDTITVYLYNSTALVNSSENSTSPLFINFTNLNDGTYYLNATVNDTTNNENQTEKRTIILDATHVIISNFQVIALNSSKGQIGTDETAFNFSNLEDIEYMNISFTLTDGSGIEGDIKIYFTANGTSACSLGNNQSTTCYNFDSGAWIEFANGTDTSTFRDIGGSAQGDSITCSYTGTSTERNYICEIDEHYNPNVWKHYPLNFSDINWQTGNTERITKDTIWKIELDTSNIPLDADFYKLDFRVNATIGLTPTQQILAYMCNSTYSTGDPSTSSECQLVTGKLPSDLQDDDTKFRGIFTNSLTNDLGDIKYVLITSDSPTSKYYSMKTYGFLGSDSVRTSISNNGGNSYSPLSDGYETELNINWFYDSTDSNLTQIVFKIYSNDTYGNDANSSEQIMTWNVGELNQPPIVDTIVPEIGSNHTGTIEINWTTAEPNGDSYLTNVTANNGTTTENIALNLADSISNTTWDTTTVSDGLWNLTVESCENSTSDLFCGNDTHQIRIDNNPPTVNIVYPENITYNVDVTQLNYTVSDAGIGLDSCWYSTDGGATNTTINCNENITGLNSGQGSNNWTVWANDSIGQESSDVVFFTKDTIYPQVNIVYPVNNTDYTVNVSQLNYTFTETNPDKCWWSNSSGVWNFSPQTCGTNWTGLTSKEGPNTWTVYINDTSGNENSSSVAFNKDTAYPTVTINSPLNQTYNTTPITFNITATDDGGEISVCWYSLNAGATNTSLTGSGDYYTNTNLSMTQGPHTVNFYCNDSYNNLNDTEQETFFIDSIVPLISFTTGTEDTGTTHSRNWIFANVTVTEDNEDTITFFLYNQTALVNETPNTNQQRTINWTGLSNEIYYYNVSINDTTGNSNSTETRTIILDTEGPQVSSLTESPNDPANYSEGGIYMFNATVTDPSLDVVWVDFNGTNYIATIFVGNIYNITLSDLGLGIYNYRWYANDSFSNLNDSENGTYTISQGIPSLSLEITPGNTVTYPTETTATGSGCPLQLDCKLYRNDTGEITSPPDVATLGVGVYNYTYNTTGNANYTSASVSDILTINKATSEVNLTLNGTDDNITINQYSSIWLNATIITPDSGNIELWYNDTLIEQGSSPQSNLTTFSSVGLFNITTFYDGNENYTSAYETWWVNVLEIDITNPNVTINSPLAQNYSTNSITFNVTAEDKSNVSSCWYSLTGGSVNYSMTETNPPYWNDTNSSMVQGWHTANFYCNDTSNNLNDTEQVTFFIDSIDPTIQFVDPTKESGESIKENYIEINVTASDDNLDTITIYLYNSASLVETNTSSSSPFNITYSSLSDGLYYFNATANDTIGNNISTETRNITLILPTLTIIKPENETYLTKKGLPLDYSASYEDYVWYINQTGSNITIFGNTTFNVSSEGLHTLYLYANNTLGEVSDNVTFTVNSSKFKIYYNKWRGSNKGTSTHFNQSSYEDIQNLSNVVLEHAQSGKIEFNEVINLTADENPTDNEVDISSHTNISSNRIEINSTALPNFNKSATLYFYGLSSDSKKALRNEEECSPQICTTPVLSAGNWSFNVTEFTIYSLEDDLPSENGVTPPSGGGGGGYECSRDADCKSGQYCLDHKCYEAECFNDTDCTEDERCRNHLCVKLFDIKIIDFESPIKLGEFFDFTYLVKGMADISDDVEIHFWIEKNGEIITSGLDTIHIGDFEEKIETTKIFLPSNIDSGIYDFFVQVSYGAYKAKSYRTIEIEVSEEGVVTISPIEIKGLKLYIISVLIALAIFILLFILYLERKKIKREFMQEKRWIKKHKILVLTFSLFIVLGVLAYYLNLFELTAIWIFKGVLWFKGNVLPYLQNYILGLIVVLAAFLILIFIIKNVRKVKRIKREVQYKGKKELKGIKYKSKIRKIGAILRRLFFALSKEERITGRFIKKEYKISTREDEIGYKKIFKFLGKSFRAIRRQLDLFIKTQKEHRPIRRPKPKKLHVLKKKKPVKKKIYLKKIRVNIKKVINKLSAIKPPKIYFPEPPEIHIPKPSIKDIGEKERKILRKQKNYLGRILGLIQEKIKKLKRREKRKVQKIKIETTEDIKRRARKVARTEKKLTFNISEFIKKNFRGLGRFILKEEEDLSKKVRKDIRRSKEIVEEVYIDVFTPLRRIFGRKSQKRILQEFEKDLVNTGRFTKRHLKTLEDIVNIRLKSKKRQLKKEIKDGRLDFYREIIRIKKDAIILTNELIEFLDDVVSFDKQKKKMEKQAKLYGREIKLIRRLPKDILETIKKIDIRKLFKKTGSEYELLKEFFDKKSKYPGKIIKKKKEQRRLSKESAEQMVDEIKEPIEEKKPAEEKEPKDIIEDIVEKEEEKKG